MKRRNSYRNVTQKDPSLGRILAVLTGIAALAYGAFHVFHWADENYFGGRAEASAHETVGEARDLVMAGRYDEAREMLEPLVSRVSHAGVTPEALLLLAKVEKEAGNLDEAYAYLQRAAKDFPRSPHQPRAAVAYAGMLEDRGEMDAAYALYEEVRANAVPELRAPAYTAFGRRAEREGDLFAARDYYEQAVKEAAWNSEEWNEALDALGEVNVELIFSRTETPESKVYEVRSGDNLTAIGVQLNTTQGLLMRANGIDDPRNLRVGQRLKYTPKDFRIVIERSTNRLFLLDNDGIFKRYYTGLGAPGSETTLGSYRIGNKQKDPTWFKPGYGPIPPNHPDNELATRWMPMVPEEEGLPTDLGIHGTIAPETIGTFASNGCARMHTEEVEELYDIVVRATPVDVVEEIEPGMFGLDLG